MVFFEIFWFILVILLFLTHVHTKGIHPYFYYSISPIVFGFLSLDAISNITYESDLYEIWGFIINDVNNMGSFVLLFLLLYIYCMIMLLICLYLTYKHRNDDEGSV